MSADVREPLTIAKENTIRGRMFNLSLKIFAAPFVRTFWVRDTAGLENLPHEGACIIAANHQSYVDFLSMVAVAPRRLTFLAAEKFYTSLLWRPVMEYSGQIKVNRKGNDKHRSIHQALKVLKSGNILAVFPQGTRSRSGEIGNTYTGVARLALTTGVPVIPLGISGAYEVWPPHAKTPSLRKVVRLSFGKPMQFEEYTGHALDGTIERTVMNRIMAEIARLAGKEYVPE